MSHNHFQYQAKAEPVLTADQFPEQVTESRWHQPWSEPVRLKPGLGAPLQYVTDVNPFPLPGDGITYASWHAPLSEPVRLKPGLGAWLQAFAAATLVPDNIIPDVVVTVTATEINGDVFLGAINVYDSGGTSGTGEAKVSIAEVIPGNDPVSIEES